MKNRPTGPKPSIVHLCCPNHPYTKRAQPCPKDKNHGCHKFAKEWKKDGMCDLEECGNCPSWWNKNKFDDGSCGDVPYAAETTASIAYAASSSTAAANDVVYLLAALGFAATIY